MADGGRRAECPRRESGPFLRSDGAVGGRERARAFSPVVFSHTCLAKDVSADKKKRDKYESQKDVMRQYDTYDKRRFDAISIIYN